MIIDKDFEPDCRHAFDALKGALIELYASVGADPDTPQEAARRFRVNKTLTWNLSKVMSSSNAIAALPSVPGTSALRGFLKAIQRVGASTEAIARVQSAAEALEQIVERHVGDRATLKLVVDGMGGEREDLLEASRKLAFRGNSGLWGVQAKTRLMTVFMAPNAQDPSRLDMAIVRGYLGLRRLRSNIRWPIFQMRGWGAADEPMTQRWKSLDADGEGAQGLPLLQRFSTVDPSDVQEVRTADGLDYMLSPGPIGNAGAIDCFLADHARSAASKYRTQIDTIGEFGATISAPTERLIFDLLVHESLDFAMSPTVHAYAGIFMQRTEGDQPDTPLPMQVPQNVESLPGRPPVVATTNVPRYSEIVGFVNERMGWNWAEFRGCRMELSFPPLGSTILLRFKLPERS